MRWTVRNGAGRVYAKLRGVEWAILFVIALLVLVMAYFAVVRAIPFEPYTTYSYDTEPNRACPGDQVSIEVERSISPNHKISAIDYESEWRSPGMVPVPSESGDLEDVGPEPRESVISPVPRTVPIEEGEWTLVTEIDVIGSVGLLRRTQEVPVQRTESPVEVMPLESEMCMDGET